MKTAAKVAIVTLLVALPAFALGNGAPLGGWWMDAWPWAHVQDEPPSNLVPFFMVLGVVEAVALGLAVSFAIWGLPHMRRLAGGRDGVATAMAVSATWLLGNWWMHDNLHQVTGFDFEGLVVIEYVFHFTLIVAGAILCYGLATGANSFAGSSAAKA